jgi:hypothetical protein
MPSTPALSSSESQSQLTLAQIQASVQEAIHEITTQKLTALRQELTQVTSLQDAVAITKVLRAIKKVRRFALHCTCGSAWNCTSTILRGCLLQAIKLRSRDPLCEFIPKVQSRFPMSDVDKDKLLAIIDLLDNHGFADITTQLTVLQSDVMAFEDVYDALEPELLVVDIRRVCVHVRIACVLIGVSCALIHACIMHSLSISTSRNAPKRSSGHRGEHQNQVLVIVHSLASCDRPSLHHAPQPHRQRKT